MVQEPSKIIAHIETERTRLAEDLEEFESRIRKVTNLRVWFDRKPGWLVGAAAVAGFVVAFLRSPHAAKMK